MFSQMTLKTFRYKFIFGKTTTTIYIDDTMMDDYCCWCYSKQQLETYFFQKKGAPADCVLSLTNYINAAIPSDIGLTGMVVNTDTAFNVINSLRFNSRITIIEPRACR